MNGEQSYLLNSVKHWFGKEEQVRHYQAELAQGVTSAEAALLRAVKPGGGVLDLGCGAGRVSVWLAERGCRVTGVDVSEPLLHTAEAKARGLSISLIWNDGLVLPFPDHSFDTIVAFKLVGYIPTRQLRHECLLEWHRVLKPGGNLLLTQNIVPDESLDEARDEYFERSPAAAFSILERGDTFPLGEGYVRWFTSEQLRSELEDTPYQLKRYESDELYGGAGYIRIAELSRLR
jgi:ubiquinone/menaquinone biosynthesis C-methylase UbiE